MNDTNGNVISGCGFGNRAAITIDGGECSMVVDCMFLRNIVSPAGQPVVYEDFPITITNNTSAVVRNCFDRNGNEYTPA